MARDDEYKDKVVKTENVEGAREVPFTKKKSNYKDEDK